MRRFVIVLCVLVGSLSLTAVPADARHPHEERKVCGTPDYRPGAIVITTDGEMWICIYDPEFDMFLWDPVDPDEGEEADTHEKSFVGFNDYHYKVSRTEYIRGTLMTGSDTYVRSPYWSPLFQPAGHIANFSRLWKWNGSSWFVCRDSGWAYTSFVTESLVPTWKWGSAPCGSGYYGNHAFGAHYRYGQWLVSGPTWSGYLYATDLTILASDSTSTPQVQAPEPGRRPPGVPAPTPKRPRAAVGVGR